MKIEEQGHNYSNLSKEKREALDNKMVALLSNQETKEMV